MVVLQLVGQVWATPAIWVLKGMNGVCSRYALDVDSGEPGDAHHTGQIPFARAPLECPRPRPAQHSLESAGGGTGSGGDVFHEAEGAAGTQDAADLGQDLGGVGHCAEHE